MAYLPHDIRSGDDADHHADAVAYDDHMSGIIRKKRCCFRKLPVVAYEKEAIASLLQQVVDPYHVISV